MKKFLIFLICLSICGCSGLNFSTSKPTTEPENLKIQALKEANELHDEKKFSAALNAFKAQADAGNEEAMYMLGLYYTMGYTGARDYGAAMHYFKLAGYHGSAKGLCGAGYLHENALGTKKDLKKAEKFYQMAHSMGYAPATLNLAELYKASGNKKLASEYYGKACSLGLKEACGIFL